MSIQGTSNKIVTGTAITGLVIMAASLITLIATGAISHFAHGANLLKNCHFVASIALYSTYISGSALIMLTAIIAAKNLQANKKVLLAVILTTVMVVMSVSVLSMGVTGAINHFSTFGSLLKYSHLIGAISPYIYFGSTGLLCLGLATGLIVYLAKHPNGLRIRTTWQPFSETLQK